MRQRNVAKKLEPSRNFFQSSNKLLTKLDVLHPKVIEDHTVTTESGGLISLFMLVIVCILFASELRVYLTQTYSDRIVVDDLLDEKLVINVNISYYALHCGKVELVAMDASGEHRLDVHGSIHKHRLASDGVTLLGEKFQQVNSHEAPGSCGSCFGAERSSKDCCQTCSDILDRYAQLGWDIKDVQSSAPQCINEKSDAEKEAKEGEGCLLEGKLHVNKVKGNFHVALGRSVNYKGRVIHQFQPEMLSKYNTSHKVNHLSFGEYSFPSQHNPLSGVERIVRENTATYRYEIKVITTTYAENGWFFTKLRRTHQYTSTETIVSVSSQDSKHIKDLPGTFFTYSLSPFLIQRSVHHETVFEFVTQLCAIIGGVVSLSKLASLIVRI